ncbi:MAG: hypothetical protein ABI443_12020 [Chthoniobacterales bacterium]
MNSPTESVNPANDPPDNDLADGVTNLPQAPANTNKLASLYPPARPNPFAPIPSRVQPATSASDIPVTFVPSPPLPTIPTPQALPEAPIASVLPPKQSEPAPSSSATVSPVSATDTLTSAESQTEEKPEFKETTYSSSRNRTRRMGMDIPPSTPAASSLQKVSRRILVYGSCLIAAAIVSAVCTYGILGPITSGPDYSINDLDPVMRALQNYYLGVFTGGKPVYPTNLEDLVKKRYLKQERLDDILANYTIDYYHPPKASGSSDGILFHAQQKLPTIYCTVSGHLRMEGVETRPNIMPPVTTSGGEVSQ